LGNKECARRDRRRRTAVTIDVWVERILRCGWTPELWCEPTCNLFPACDLCRPDFAWRNPANLPVEQPTRFELAVNLKTAKTLKIDVATSILLRADKVIE
jgi:hypothetical protein